MFHWIYSIPRDLIFELPNDAASIDKAGGHTSQRSSTSLDVLVSMLRSTYNIALGSIGTTRPFELVSTHEAKGTILAFRIVGSERTNILSTRC